MPGVVSVGIGLGVTAGGFAAGAVGTLAVTAAATSIASGIHGLVNAPGSPKIPEIPKAGQARKKANQNVASAITSRPKGGAKSQTLLTGPKGISDDLLSGNQSPQQTLLG